MIPELMLQMDKLKKNVQALQVDQAGNPDAEVTQLIALLMTDGSDGIKARVCGKLDDQARAIALRDQVITDLRAQLKDAQDKPEIDDTQLIGASYSPVPTTTWLNREPEGDNGAYARGLRL